jgi:hypothetical protein
MNVMQKLFIVSHFKLDYIFVSIKKILHSFMLRYIFLLICTFNRHVKKKKKKIRLLYHVLHVY